MFSEEDNEYNDFLLGLGKHKRNEFKGKDVLLLGGGGGSGLNRVMQEEPNMVVMCEVSYGKGEVAVRLGNSVPDSGNASMSTSRIEHNRLHHHTFKKRDYACIPKLACKSLPSLGIEPCMKGVCVNHYTRPTT